MKLNNKGFAITAVLYGLLILFVMLVSSYLMILSARKNRVDNLVKDIEEEYFENITNNQQENENTGGENNDPGNNEEEPQGRTIYTVTLFPGNYILKSNGTTTLYFVREENKWYYDGNATREAIFITLPARTMYIFNGYYTSPDGRGTKIINADGSIRSIASNYINDDITLYAHWLYNNGGSGDATM